MLCFSAEAQEKWEAKREIVRAVRNKTEEWRRRKAGGGIGPVLTAANEGIMDNLNTFRREG